MKTQYEQRQTQNTFQVHLFHHVVDVVGFVSLVCYFVHVVVVFIAIVKCCLLLAQWPENISQTFHTQRTMAAPKQVSVIVMHSFGRSFVRTCFLL